MSVTFEGETDEAWGDGPAAFAPGDATALGGRPHALRRTTRPSRACSARCCSPRTPSPTWSRRSAAPTSTGRRTRPSTTRSSTSTVAASRPTRSPSPPSCSGAASCSGSAARRTCTRSSASVPIAANAAYYAEIVREKAILRRLVDAGTRIAQMGYAGEGQVDDVVDRAQAEVYEVTERRSAEDYAPAERHHGGHPRRDRGDLQPRRRASSACPTGFADLDDLTNGLHARPDDHRRGAARDREVDARPRLLPGRVDPQQPDQRASSRLEMTRNEITMRLLSAEAKVPLNHMRNGHDERRGLGQARPQDGRGLRGADVHRRLPRT